MLKKICGKIVAVSSLAMVTASAQAEITAVQLESISTPVLADAGTIATWAFTLLGGVYALTIGFKLVKRFTSAAT